jgi:3-(3-hydroxy-phenyl)propionate hydroxylase
MNFDVVVIGCGPVGALASNLLGRAGLRTLVIEQEAQPYPLPRAVHLDHEMMRLFQSAGVIDRVRADMRDTEGHLHVGADHGVIRYMGTVGRPRPFGWSNDYFFYQPELEEHLRQALVQHPSIELRFGARFEGLRQEDDGVTVMFREGAVAQEIRGRWVIACDGARSSVRKALGVRLDDLDFEEPWLVVDAEVAAPVRFPPISGVPEAANLQQLSVMMCDPRRPTTIVPGRGNHRRWEFMLLPGEGDQEMMRPENVARLVGPYLDGVPHTILRAATYRFHGLIAERWQVGNVFLAGDAAHQTPPFFGQGMCHGFRDVANLAWKMALVAGGKAGSALLDTYQPERDPHVRAVISAAVATGRYICVLDPVAAAARDAEMRERAKQAQPTTAADLIPPISAGVVADRPNSGARFIQPWIVRGEGRALLDDVTGDGWRLFVADAALADRAAEAVVAELPGLGVTIWNVEAIGDDGALKTWLADHQALAVLVRPDHYVFGTTVDDLEALLRSLRDRLHLRVGQAGEVQAA